MRDEQWTMVLAAIGALAKKAPPALPAVMLNQDLLGKARCNLNVSSAEGYSWKFCLTVAADVYVHASFMSNTELTK